MTIDEMIKREKRKLSRMKLGGWQYPSYLVDLRPEINYQKQLVKSLEELKAIKEIIDKPKGCLGCFSNCENCGNERYSEIEKIVKVGGKEWM